LAGGAAFPALKALWSDPEIRARKPYYRFAPAVTRCAHPYTPDFIDPDLRRLEETFHQALIENLSGEDWLKRLASGSHKLALRSVSDQIVRRAMAYIEDNLADIRTVTQVAASVKRNPDYVNRLFRRELKQSCRTYLAHRRMERARDMLVDVTLSLKEIAARIGIRSAASFSRTCQQHWRCSAVQMRKREWLRIHGGQQQSDPTAHGQ
jgi:AraC-like DNA-binding protein